MAAGLPLAPLSEADQLWRLYVAWQQFCDATDAVTAGAQGWQIVGGRREAERYVTLMRVELEKGLDGIQHRVERHRPITLSSVRLSEQGGPYV